MYWPLDQVFVAPARRGTPHPDNPCSRRTSTLWHAQSLRVKDGRLLRARLHARAPPEPRVCGVRPVRDSPYRRPSKVSLAFTSQVRWQSSTSSLFASAARRVLAQQPPRPPPASCHPDILAEAARYNPTLPPYRVDFSPHPTARGPRG